MPTISWYWFKLIGIAENEDRITPWTIKEWNKDKDNTGKWIVVNRTDKILPKWFKI